MSDTAIASMLRGEAMILRDMLGQLRPSVRDKVDGVAMRLCNTASQLEATASPCDSSTAALASQLIDACHGSPDAARAAVLSEWTATACHACGGSGREGHGETCSSCRGSGRSGAKL